MESVWHEEHMLLRLDIWMWEKKNKVLVINRTNREGLLGILICVKEIFKRNIRTIHSIGALSHSPDKLIIK